jgi:hypothetical protein
MSETQISIRDGVDIVLHGEVKDERQGVATYAIKLEEDHTLRIVSLLKALQSGSEKFLQLDDDGNLKVVTNEGVSTVTRRIVDPLTAAIAPGANLWNPALGAAGYLDFEVFIANVTNPGASSTISLRIDAAGKYLLRDFNMPAGYQFKLPHTVRMGTDDILWASASVAAAIDVHIRIVDEGTAT